MASTRSISLWLLFLSVLASAPRISLAHADAVGAPDLPAACAENTKASLRRDVSELAKPQAAGAWKLIETFLCADKTHARVMFEKAHSESVLFRIAAPTGVEEKPVEDINQELQNLLPARRAWGPSVRKEDEDLVIYYSISDTCWDFFGLRFVDKKWQLVTLGGGCD